MPSKNPVKNLIDKVRKRKEEDKGPDTTELEKINGVGNARARKLYRANARTPKELARRNPESLAEASGLSETVTEKLVDAAKKHLNPPEPEPEPKPEPEKEHEPEKKPPETIDVSELEPLTVTDPRKQEWTAERSKIKAAIENGLTDSYLSVKRLLYIGAAHGYTIAHTHERPEQLYAVEKSGEMMRHFLPLAQELDNVLPIYADANSPDSYAHYIPQQVDVVFQDIAQKDQVGIFLRNCEQFLTQQGVGLLALKARAIDSQQAPEKTYAQARQQLEEGGATIVQEISLEPHQKDHTLFVVHLTPAYDW